ncbi:MAG: bifunctional 3,4-dihydroxy-2-butanone-4-phosphate synthase/GTP cyclohydrolase II [Burkholderia sp.]|nr:bifunctional 3,4-dihydroxy-2-butanone-4-phosphate synthase/GTP cyclohydrolase II [Burkholderia sp.]
MTLASTLDIIAELKVGRMVILIDEEDRENEGDLVIAAEFVTPEAINFMAKYGRGLICLTMTYERCKQLNLPLMTHRNGARYGTAFTVSIEAADGVTTGISAADRARTIRTAVAHDALPSDIVQPGHIFPIMAQPGGVLQRAGHTEAGCDFASLSGLVPASAICEIIKDDGTMARLPDLIEFSKKHDMKIGTIADLINYRSQTESVIERIAKCTMQTIYGLFDAVMYHDRATKQPHIALVRGTPSSDTDIPVYVHDSLSILDLLQLDRSTTCSSTFDAAMRHIVDCNNGVILLLNYGDMKENLVDLFKKFEFDNKKRIIDSSPQRWITDLKMLGIGAQILHDLGVCKIKILANQHNLSNIANYGLHVTGFISETS